jgi:predicted RNase H-like nuclease (RuvC/YqgF family)
MDEACSKALQHVHNGTDTENQWRRAVQCLRTMDELRVALAWQRLSAPLQTRITLSQYKMLFKCALRAAEREAEKERVVVELPIDYNVSKHREHDSETSNGSSEQPDENESNTQTKESAEAYKQLVEMMSIETLRLKQENEKLHQESQDICRENIRLQTKVMDLMKGNSLSDSTAP